MAPKKVVRVETPTRPAGAPAGQAGGPTWQATPQAKGRAMQLRIIALVLWAAAITTEVIAGIWAWKHKNWDTTSMVAIIVVIVVIGILAVIGDFLWKRANRLDPASRADPVRFFIQNQLGAIIALVAFVPLIAVILLNKNMSAQQKGIAGGIGAIALVIAVLAGVTINPPSIEGNTASMQPSFQSYPAEEAVVVGYTGQNLVFWTKEGSVYHLCQQASAVNEQSKDNTIYSGTVGAAHAAGKDRLTLQVATELKQCGLTTPSPVSS